MSKLPLYKGEVIYMPSYDKCCMCGEWVNGSRGSDGRIYCYQHYVERFGSPY
jgi:hypothetical protein